MSIPCAYLMIVAISGVPKSRSTLHPVDGPITLCILKGFKKVDMELDDAVTGDSVHFAFITPLKKKTPVAF